MKYFLSVLLGLFSGLILMSIFEYLALMIFPLPEDINIKDFNSIANNMDRIPDINLIMLLVCFAISSMFAGFISAKVKTKHSRIPVLIIGILLTVGCFIYCMEIPQPVWVVILSSVIFLPMAYLGGRLGIGYKRKMYTY